VAAAGGAAGAGGMGAAPVLAAAGGGSSIGQLSVPPGWAGGAGIPAASTPATLASQSWTAGRTHRRHVDRCAGHHGRHCPRSPVAIADARPSAPRATASSPRSCPRFPSRRSPESMAAAGGRLNSMHGSGLDRPARVTDQWRATSGPLRNRQRAMPSTGGLRK
jgi:hypothetical protein